MEIKESNIYYVVWLLDNNSHYSIRVYYYDRYDKYCRYKSLSEVSLLKYLVNYYPRLPFGRFKAYTSYDFYKVYPEYLVYRIGIIKDIHNHIYARYLAYYPFCKDFLDSKKTNYHI